MWMSWFDASNLPYLAAALVLLLSLCYWYRPGPPLPPGPWGLPVLGYLPWIAPATPHLTLTTLARRYGRIYSLQMGGVFTVVLSDHRLIRQAFAKDEFSGRAPLYLTHGIMQGYGLICAEGELWKDQRKFVASCLKNFGMVKFGTKRDQLEQRILVGVHDAVSRLRLLASTPHDILPVLLHSIGNVVNDLVFGKTWASDDETWQWLQHLQEEGTKMIGVAGPLNFLPFLRFLPRFRKTIGFLLEGKGKTHDLYEEIIRKFLEEGDGDKGKSQHMIAAYLAEMEKKATTGSAGFYTRAQFLHLLADLFGAGLDTTLMTVRWFILFMAVNQDVQARVYNELASVLGRRLPTLGDVAALPYTEAALAEAQRMRSVTPLGIPHGTTKDTVLDGYRIPRGTMVVPLQWALHMDPSLWTLPEKFNPDRFLDASGRFFKPDFFIPFQTGNRMCVGEEYARMLVFLFGATLVHQFHFAPPAGATLDTEGDCGITLTPRPHSLAVTPRHQ